jgi:phosphohistidine phosphatase SixA
MSMLLRLSGLLAMCLVAAQSAVGQQPLARVGPAAVVNLLKQPGHIGFMRHAWAPFEGAPKEGPVTAEALGPCGKQRNLDDKGRMDSRRIGALFAKEGVVFEHVFTSKWCRCRETAELIMGRKVDNLPLLDSFYSDPDKAVRAPVQLAALKAHIAATFKPTDRALMVTHGSLITDLAGIDTDENEVVVMKSDGRGGLVVVGRGVP